jgi:rubrerythrin
LELIYWSSSIKNAPQHVLRDGFIRINRVSEMLSKIPFDLTRLSKDSTDKEILRAAMIAELDAISLYEQLAAMTQNKGLKTVLMDIAKEEKTHAGEFQALLLKLDPEQEKELVEGRKEVEELTK